MVFRPRTSDKKMLLASHTLSILFIVLGLTINPLWLSLTGFTMSWFFPFAMSWLTSPFIEGKDYIIAYTMTCSGVLLAITHISFSAIIEEWGISTGMAASVFFLMVSLTLIIMRESILSDLFQKSTQQQGGHQPQ